MKNKLTINSFFAGIGGFDLGFEKLGFKVQYQCELNEFCNQILRRHWPEVRLERDITMVDVEKLPNADIWCGGFPCQDVSVARGAMGREGLKGKNTGLFYTFLDLIKAKEPEIVLLENVTGLLNSHNGNDFKVILESFTSLGYAVSWRVFNSRYFGVPQSRPRVYICAWKGNIEKAVFALHEFEGSIKPQNTRSGFLEEQTDLITKISVPKVAYCLAATSGRHTGTDWSRTYVSYRDKVRRLTPEEMEKLQGFPPHWTVPNNLNSKDKLDIDTHRYHAIGNAVSVPVVAWIADRLLKAKKHKPAKNGINGIFKNYADFSENIVRTQFISQLNEKTLFEVQNKNKIKWQSGGFAYGDKIVDCNVHHCPTIPFESNLMEIIEVGEVDAKYFISSSAAIGILRRVNSQDRQLYQPLQRALEKLAGKQKQTRTTA